MFVRTAGERDVDKIRALLVETWQATYTPIHGAETVARINASWHGADALKGQIMRPDAEFLVADDGKLLGGMAYAFAEAGGKTVILRQLYVRPELQGRGIGSMLLDEIIESFADAHVFRLEVDEANPRAIDFYVSQGFERVGRSENCGAAGSGIPALIFERRMLQS